MGEDQISKELKTFESNVPESDLDVPGTNPRSNIVLPVAGIQTWAWELQLPTDILRLRPGSPINLKPPSTAQNGPPHGLAPLRLCELSGSGGIATPRPLDKTKPSFFDVARHSELRLGSKGWRNEPAKVGGLKHIKGTRTK